MTRARLPIVLLGTTLLALGLTACDQPNPGASVFSGTTSKWSQAVCWADEGETIDAAACAKDLLAKDSVPTIPVVPGQVVGISVDPVVADAGWTPRINDQNLTQAPITSTYFRFTFPEFQDVPADGLSMQLVAGTDQATRGVWVFKLAPPA